MRPVSMATAYGCAGTSWLARLLSGWLNPSARPAAARSSPRVPPKSEKGSSRSPSSDPCEAVHTCWSTNIARYKRMWISDETLGWLTGEIWEREHAKARTRLGQCWNDRERNNQGEEIYAQENLVYYRVRRDACRAPMNASTSSELLRRQPTLRLFRKIYLR